MRRSAVGLPHAGLWLSPRRRCGTRLPPVPGPTRLAGAHLDAPAATSYCRPIVPPSGWPYEDVAGGPAARRVPVRVRGGAVHRPVHRCPTGRERAGGRDARRKRRWRDCQLVSQARIAELAAHLLTTRSAGAEGVISPALFWKNRRGWAELERAWPIGPHTTPTGSVPVPLGVTADGRIVLLRHGGFRIDPPPARGLALGTRDELEHYDDTRQGMFTDDWRMLERVLSTLEQANSKPEADDSPSSGQQQERPPKPLTVRQQNECSRIRQQLYEVPIVIDARSEGSTVDQRGRPTIDPPARCRGRRPRLSAEVLPARRRAAPAIDIARTRELLDGATAVAGPGPPPALSDRHQARHRRARHAQAHPGRTFAVAAGHRQARGAHHVPHRTVRQDRRPPRDAAAHRRLHGSRDPQPAR